MGVFHGSPDRVELSHDLLGGDRVLTGAHGNATGLGGIGGVFNISVDIYYRRQSACGFARNGREDEFPSSDHKVLTKGESVGTLAPESGDHESPEK